MLNTIGLKFSQCHIYTVLGSCPCVATGFKIHILLCISQLTHEKISYVHHGFDIIIGMGNRNILYGQTSCEHRL
jgi:hypothetical protein